ncbi:unnamed protein product, partial [Callosobruchus maculatus]
MHVLSTLPEDKSHAVLEAVNIYMIRGFCTDKAFEKIVEQKRFRQCWTCMCGKDKNDRTLRCSGCLLWRYNRCAGLSR